MKVAVTLQRKKGAKYVKVSSASAAVKSLMDRDADGLTDGSYVAILKRPTRGTYRVLVKYVGNADYLACAKTLALRI